MTKERVCANSEELSKNQPNIHHEFGTFDERLAHFCLLMEIEKPDWPCEGGEPLLTDETMEWIKEHGPNMDWLFAGSPSGMLSADASRRKIELAAGELEPELQQGFVAMLRAVVLHEVPLEAAMSGFRAVKDELHKNNH